VVLQETQPTAFYCLYLPDTMHDSQASRQSAAKRKLNLARFWIGGEPRGAPSTRAQTGQRYALGNFQLVAGVQSASSRGPGFEHSLLLLLLLYSPLLSTHHVALALWRLDSRRSLLFRLLDAGRRACLISDNCYLRQTSQ